MWFRIIKNYSSRKLSFQSDKLVAISGLAQKMRHLLGEDVYIAGIWKSNLLHSLLWSANKSSLKRSVEYCAPSWSWASMNCALSFPPDIEDVVDVCDFTRIESDLPSAAEIGQHTDRAVISEVDVPLASSDIFGPVAEGGSISLTGRWCKVRIETSDLGPDYESPEIAPDNYLKWIENLFPGVDISYRNFTLSFVDDLGKPVFVSEESSLSFPKLEGRSPHNRNLFAGDAMSFSLDEYLRPDMFEVYSSWYTFELQHISQSYFLMLRKCAGGREGYLRIGLAQNIQLKGNESSIGLENSLWGHRTIKIF